jgi:creatinine amidohydrolase
MRIWEQLAWPELSELAGEVGLVPVGATEQHGPHLPTATDTMIATAVCQRVSEQTGAIVLPAVPVAASYGHGTALPGTLSLTPLLLAQVVCQYAEWAAATSRLTRLLLVNAHYGNSAALGIATDHLRLHRPDLQIGAVDWWSVDPAVAKAMAADGEDVHANCGETSVMLALAPDLVHLDRLAEADDPDRTAGLVFRYTATSLSTNGVTGRPSDASAELGEELLDRAVAGISALVERGRQEEPPLGRATAANLSTGEITWTP